MARRVIADFDPDELFDYRSRRPTLEIRDGRLSSLAWPEITLRHARLGGRDLLVLTGAEPDDRWRRFGTDVMELLALLDVNAWVSLGAIPAAVPHTRPVPILGTEARPGLLRGGVSAGPTGLLRVPAAALSMLEMAAADAGLAAVGYFAQIPHYVSGPYAVAAVELLRAIERHLDIELPRGDLAEEARLLRLRLDAAAAARRGDANVRGAPRVDGRRVAASRGRRPHHRDRAVPPRPEQRHRLVVRVRRPTGSGCRYEAQARLLRGGPGRRPASSARAGR